MITQLYMALYPELGRIISKANGQPAAAKSPAELLGISGNINFVSFFL